MNNVSFIPLFATPVMQVQLDIDSEKLTELAFQLQNKDKKGVQVSNRGGWQSNDISEEKHEEFIKLKKEIIQHLQIYHTEVFQGMIFKKNVVPMLDNIWVNINEKHHYNDWHIHPHCTLSGAYYIKHDGSRENGVISFQHPHRYMASVYWPKGLVQRNNNLTAEIIDFIPKSNKLLIFPSWLEHRVEANLKNDSRISLSFNSAPQPEIK